MPRRRNPLKLILSFTNQSVMYKNNTNGHHLFSSSQVPSSWMLCILISNKSYKKIECQYYFHFTDKEAQISELSINLSKFLQPVSESTEHGMAPVLN